METDGLACLGAGGDAWLQTLSLRLAHLLKQVLSPHAPPHPWLLLGPELCTLLFRLLAHTPLAERGLYGLCGYLAGSHVSHLRPRSHGRVGSSQPRWSRRVNRDASSVTWPGAHTPGRLRAPTCRQLPRLLDC